MTVAEVPEHDKPWQPLTVAEVGELFAGAPFRWWIAGGLALELAVGHSIRAHGDTDVLVVRSDHVAVRAWLGDWDCRAADPPGVLVCWPVGRPLGAHVHDVWCRRASDDVWRLQLMIDESIGDHWMSRRDARVRTPIDAITRIAPGGVRYLAPHIELYYKAKWPRARDEVDLQAVLASGIEVDYGWLVNAIATAYGIDHPWLAALRV